MKREEELKKEMEKLCKKEYWTPQELKIGFILKAELKGIQQTNQLWQKKVDNIFEKIENFDVYGKEKWDVFIKKLKSKINNKGDE